MMEFARRSVEKGVAVNRVAWCLLSVCCAGLIVSAAAAGPDREQTRSACFAQLHGAERGSLHGTFGGQSVSLYLAGNWLTGTGPHGSVSLRVANGSASGTSGNQHVSLHEFGGWVTGQGPGGRVSLRTSSTSIHGTIGPSSVFVQVIGTGWITGTCGGSTVNMRSFDSLDPAVVALILGSL